MMINQHSTDAIRHRFRMLIPAYPAFNIYSRIAKITTALGPACVATIVNKTADWDVEIIDENNYRRPGPLNAEGKPDHRTMQQERPADVVGLYGGLTSTIPRLYELAAIYKKAGVVTIAGGQHFSGENIEHALKHGIDYIVRGEGETIIRQLLKIIETQGDPSQIKGISFMRDGQIVHTMENDPITEFHEWPLPDFSLLRYAKVTLFPIGWVRGCGMNCEFCTVKGKPRADRPERVVEQIIALLEKHSAHHFFLVDDLFGQFRAETLRLCELLQTYQQKTGIRLDITAQIRLDKAKDTELLKAMRAASINTVCIGYESPIPEELKAMHKHINPDEMVELTRLYHKAGFLVHGMFIFGYPLPKDIKLVLPLEKRIKAFHHFIKKARIDTVQILLPVPLPGTELTERLGNEHRLFSTDDVGWEYYDGNFPLIEPDAPLTPETMQKASRRIMGRFYRFHYMFSVARNIIIFPAMIFSLWNIKFGWRKWYRYWRNDLIRFGGWIILHRWTTQLRKGNFKEKLHTAEANLLTKHKCNT